MDFQKTEPGLPRGVREALADPIVEALMAADRVDRKAVVELLQRTAARLALPPQESGCARVAQRAFVLALAVVAGLSAAPRFAAADDAPVAFIQTLGAQAVSVLRSAAALGTSAIGVRRARPSGSSSVTASSTG